MKYDLNQEDVDLILKALEGLKEGGIFYSSNARDLAVRQRVEAIKKKLSNDDE